MRTHITKIKFIRNTLLDHFRYMIVERQFRKKFGRDINWKEPKDINEKIQWLIRYSDISIWAICSDKYKVRDFVAKRGLSNILIKQYGVWENAFDINFDLLPDKFVLKCNHDSGSSYIINKHKGFNQETIVNALNTQLKRKYGYVHGEMWYNEIKPLIIAEEFLEQKDDLWTTSLVDYKIWCFDGKPFSVWACYSRSSECTFVNIYDLNWQVHPEHSVFTDHYRDGKGLIPKPKKFDEMLQIAAILSKGFPEVRVDLYNVDGQIYFGELTFASLCGFMDFYTTDYLEELGNQVSLPPKKKKWGIL